MDIDIGTCLPNVVVFVALKISSCTQLHSRSNFGFLKSYRRIVCLLPKKSSSSKRVSRI